MAWGGDGLGEGDKIGKGNGLSEGYGWCVVGGTQTVKDCTAHRHTDRHTKL